MVFLGCADKKTFSLLYLRLEVELFYWKTFKKVFSASHTHSAAVSRRELGWKMVSLCSVLCTGASGTLFFVRSQMWFGMFKGCLAAGMQGQDAVEGWGNPVAAGSVFFFFFSSPHMNNVPVLHFFNLNSASGNYAEIGTHKCANK